MLNFKNNINNFQCQISKKNQIKNKSDIEDKIIIELIKQAIKENSKTKQDKNFSILFKKYYNKVILFLIKNFKNLSKEDIEDIVSDVFLKTYNKIKLYDIQNTYFKSRFFKLAKNTAIDEIRQRKAKINWYKYIDVSEIKNIWFIEKQIEDIYFQETNQLIQNHVSIFNPILQKIFDLRFNQWFQYEEIAEILKLQIWTVKNAIFRIRKKLEICLSK